MKSAIGGAPRASTPQHRYELFGMPFESAEPIPGLTEADGKDRAGAIQIRFGCVPQAIENPDYEDEMVQANASEYLFSYPGTLRFYMNGASQIVVERLERCDPVRLWTLVLGAGAAIAGFRRGFAPLHASAIKVGDGCIALAGQSGFGKSTLAASLTEFGFTLHADDLCLIKPASSGRPVVGAGVQELRLWDDAVEVLNWSGREPYAAVPEISKSVYRLPHMQSWPLPLKRIYALEFADEETPAGIFRIEGVAALQSLIGCLRLRMGLLSVGMRQRTFENLASISREVEVFRFVRPHDRKQLCAWSKRLASHLTA